MSYSFGFGVTAEDVAMLRDALSRARKKNATTTATEGGDEEREEEEEEREEEEEEEKREGGERQPRQSGLKLSSATKHIFSIGWPTMLQNVSAAIASLFAVSLISHH